MSASLKLAREYLGLQVSIVVDRRLGSLHPTAGFRYELNYGYVPGTMAPDGEELDAYLIGPTEPIEQATGECVAIVHRLYEDDDKLVVVVGGADVHNDSQLRDLIAFQEGERPYIVVRLLDPQSRPTLALRPMLDVLQNNGVEYVIAGSTVFKLHGADIEPADLDIVPAQTPANLRRLAQALAEMSAIPAFTPGWREDFTVETCLAWRPYPETVEQLEYLYVTTFGMLDLPMSMCGTYSELIAASTPMQVEGFTVQVADPHDALRRATQLRSPKHLARSALYAALEERLPH